MEKTHGNILYCGNKDVSLWRYNGQILYL